jgi:hypothetical protein
VARVPIPLAERHRRKAEKLRALATEMSDGEGKAALLRAAEGYDEMARRAAT